MEKGVWRSRRVDCSKAGGRGKGRPRDSQEAPGRLPRHPQDAHKRPPKSVFKINPFWDPKWGPKRSSWDGFRVVLGLSWGGVGLVLGGFGGLFGNL